MRTTFTYFFHHIILFLPFFTFLAVQMNWVFLVCCLYSRSTFSLKPRLIFGSVFTWDSGGQSIFLFSLQFFFFFPPVFLFFRTLLGTFMFLWVSKDSFGFFRPSHIVFVIFSGSLRVLQGFPGLSRVFRTFQGWIMIFQDMYVQSLWTKGSMFD